MKRLLTPILAALLLSAGGAAWAQDAKPCRAPTQAGYFPAKQAGKPAVVVFVHGVIGDPVGTWLDKPFLSPNVFWPCVVKTHPAFADANVYLAGYRSRPLADSPTIEEAAAALYSDLDLDGVLSEHSHVAFVAHSLGGLEVIRLVTQRKDHPDMRKVRFVRFYGAPALGSNWASLAAALSTNKQFPEMADTRRLERWTDEWKRESARLGIRSFCGAEQEGFGIIFKSPPVVTPESAAALCGGEHEKLWLNHVKLVKPRSGDEDPHKLLASSYGKCVTPKIFGHRFDESDSDEGAQAIHWFRTLRNQLVHVANARQDVARAAQGWLHGTPGVLHANRYSSPRAGNQSLAPAENMLLDGNSFAKEFRDQLVTLLPQLRVEMAVSLERLGETLGHSDAYELSRSLVRNAGFGKSDMVVVARLSDHSLDRVLLFVAAQPAKGSAPDALLRGFALVRRPAECGARVASSPSPIVTSAALDH